MGRAGRRSGSGGGSRRQFIRHAGQATLALGALPLLKACAAQPDGQQLPTPPGSGAFRHGVASGDPLADRVILWTRITPETPASAGPVAVELVIATDTALAQVVARHSLGTDASRDFTVKLDAGGLQPDTTYYYRFTALGVASPIGRTRTLPAGTASRLRLAVVSCSNLAQGFFNAYRRVAERADLDLVLHLGDYLYEHGNEDGAYRAVEPPSEIVTLADYRLRHAQYKRDPDLQALHRQHPVIAIWDDHDIASDARASGSPNHTDSTEGPWATRVAAALQAFYEWLPVRRVDANEPRRNYRSFSIGNLVDLMMLEERLLARSAQLPGNSTLSGSFRQRGEFNDPARQVLGTEQETWLAERLRSSSARWKFIGQGVMLAQLKLQAQSNADGGGLFVNADQWDGYQPARDRLFQMIAGDAGHPAVGNVVVLTGDAHSAWAADLTPDPNNGNTYDPASGTGSLAVEFVTTSVTSPMIIDTHNIVGSVLRSFNPHLKYIELSRRGYLLIDADATRVVGEWWYVDTVEHSSTGQTFATAFQVSDGSRHLVPAGPTASRPNPPPLAPG